MFFPNKLTIVVVISLVLTTILLYFVAHKPIEKKQSEITAKDFLTLPDPPKINTTATLPRAGG